MKILLTGISGTVGSLLAPELGRDHEVSGVDLRPSDWPNATQGRPLRPGRPAPHLRRHRRSRPPGR